MKNHEGKPIGTANNNPILDPRQYKAEYTNSYKQALSAIVIVERFIGRMTLDANTWNSLLCLSGGKLALEKCLYYVVKWNRKNGRATPEGNEKKLVG